MFHTKNMTDFCDYIVKFESFLYYRKVGFVQPLLSKFNIQSLSRPKHELKLHIWDTFVSETVCRGHWCVTAQDAWILIRF